MSVHVKFIQTKFFRVCVLFVLIWIGFHFGPVSVASTLRVFVTTFTTPFQKIISSMAFEIHDVSQFLSSIGELKNENERLEKERLRLLAENAQYVDVIKENDDLRREIGLLPRDKFFLKASTIIGRDISGMGNWLLIDQGSFDGMKEGMVVIIENGIFVGRIIEVFPTSSRIMLLSNPESLMSGTTLDTDAKGIVKGEYGLGLLFDMVSQTDILKEGSSVVTSGLGGDVPRGLLIGTLQEPHLSSDRLFQQASILSPIRFDHIRYVFVIQNVL